MYLPHKPKLNVLSCSIYRRHNTYHNATYPSDLCSTVQVFSHSIAARRRRVCMLMMIKQSDVYTRSSPSATLGCFCIFPPYFSFSIPRAFWWEQQKQVPVAVVLPRQLQTRFACCSIPKPFGPSGKDYHTRRPFVHR
jgi:hypothetical protein